MRIRDLIGTAVKNTFRNGLRTTLTALAIVIGALTLALTLAVNTGLNSYIDDTIATVGSEDTLTLTKPTGELDEGIARFDPDTGVASGSGTSGPALDRTVGAVEPLTPEDLDTLAGLDGVESVHTVRSVQVDYILLAGAPDEDRWELAITPSIPGVSFPVAAGTQPDQDSADRQITLPRDYVETLGFTDAADLVGLEVELGVSDPTGAMDSVTAVVVGISEPVLTVTSPSASPNPALTDAIFDIQARGPPDELQERWGMAAVTVATQDGVPLSESVAQVKEQLAEAGYDGRTVNDLLGQFRAFFDAILLMLIGFAVITLMAGSLGIVNTLLMSVQERTREIGLLKALGLTSRRVFTLFSLEAVAIGVLSAGIGILAPVALAPSVNRALANGPLADLPGLELFSFTPGVVAGVATVIIAIAFLAGTLPAARAARKDPVTALRYE